MSIFELNSEINTKIAAEFSGFMKSAGKGPVVLRINSPGGSITAGMSMADIIQRQGNVTAEVVGLAASMGSVLTVVAKRSRMSSSGLLMVHNAWSQESGDAASLRKAADTLEKFSSSLLTYYREKTGKTSEVIKGWMDAETWFTAEEALAAGLVDSVFKGTDPRAALRWSAKFPNLTNRLKAASESQPSLLSIYNSLPSGPARQEFFAKHKTALWALRSSLKK
jgi:ATP-dependent Clp endopeptidase proteolytic subunit ClpP